MKAAINNIEVLPETAQKLLHSFKTARVFAFHGELGAGKTTFIKTICQSLGVKETMSSPTFSLVNEYHDRDGKAIYHLDLYRIKSTGEALDLGIEEYLYSGNYCFIEWPERAQELLPENTVHVYLEEKNGARLIRAR
ncbi:MAG TPA: tRNA (adenosine(37)-N6)-threonylcarbamoyltransferase complex ATPase subunit type 1 TsaE [Bacteroidia bacterium]|nr:tRNA (adenosine(37)-N6)-threonylcarbamoyltransferase complex ATPase subunit type 1 TsaE [Bacteroidia bacterium]